MGASSQGVEFTTGKNPVEPWKAELCFRESRLAVVWNMDQSRAEQLEGCVVIQAKRRVA